MDIHSALFHAPIHHEVKVQQKETPIFGDLSHIEESQNFCNTTLLDSTLKVEIVKGLRNVRLNLDGRSYQSSSFAAQLLSLVFALRVPVWGTVQHLDPTRLSICKASGSLTNAVYFVSYPPSPFIPTILLRIFGPSSGSLISRNRELHILRILSSRYNIGPHIYGTFSNGRIEEYFNAETLGPSDLPDERISRWIAANMAELHSVDITAIEGLPPARSLEGKGWEIGIRENIEEWLPMARQVLAHSDLDESDCAVLCLDTFAEAWARYLHWLSQVEEVEGTSLRVLAHNDTQCGNILRLTGKLAEGLPEHRQLVIVDFEYASPNPFAFDIANHFHEWTADYHSSAPHLLHFSRYPTAQQRFNFYKAYLSRVHALSESPETEVNEARLAKLDRQVSLWSPASHGMWAIWGIVQAKDDLVSGDEATFDHIAYAKCRMERFFHETRTLGV